MYYVHSKLSSANTRARLWLWLWLWLFTRAERRGGIAISVASAPLCSSIDTSALINARPFLASRATGLSSQKSIRSLKGRCMVLVRVLPETGSIGIKKETYVFYLFQNTNLSVTTAVNQHFVRNDGFLVNFKYPRDLW